MAYPYVIQRLFPHPMSWRSLRLAILVLSFACAMAGGGARAQSAPRAVLELFTSQGCASCPPADELLSELAGDPSVIALTLAVDYWDYVGWKDTLARRSHSLRQRAYADLRGDRMIYTPQVVINGVLAAKGSDRTLIHTLISRFRTDPAMLAVPVRISQMAKDLVIEVGSDPRSTPHALPGSTDKAAAQQSSPMIAHDAMTSADIWVCPVISRQSVAIGRGENAGKTLSYTNVVRGWIRLGPWSGEPARFHVDMSRIALDGVDGVVVMVQNGTPTAPGPIIGASWHALH